MNNDKDNIETKYPWKGLFTLNDDNNQSKQLDV